jgi:hypothetical protein
VSGVSLSVVGITQCSVCLWGNQGPSVSRINSWVGCENFQWEEKSLKVSISLNVMGIFLGVSVMGITQCNGYPLGFRVSLCVRLSIRSSDILLARFVRRLIGQKDKREMNSLSLTHTQIRRWVLTHSHTQLGLILEIFKECSQKKNNNKKRKENAPRDFTVSEGHGHQLVPKKRGKIWLWKSQSWESILK